MPGDRPALRPRRGAAGDRGAAGGGRRRGSSGARRRSSRTSAGAMAPAATAPAANTRPPAATATTAGTASRRASTTPAAAIVTRRGADHAAGFDRDAPRLAPETVDRAGDERDLAEQSAGRLLPRCRTEERARASRPWSRPPHRRSRPPATSPRPGPAARRQVRRHEAERGPEHEPAERRARGGELGAEQLAHERSGDHGADDRDRQRHNDGQAGQSSDLVEQRTRSRVASSEA